MVKAKYSLIIILIFLGCNFKNSESQQQIFTEILRAIDKRDFRSDVLKEQYRFEYEKKLF